VPTQSLVRTILSEDPYPIKMAWCSVTNPILTYPDSAATYEAFMKLPFLVVAEIFPTSFTAIADIVLPAATPLEHNSIAYWPAWLGHVKAQPKCVEPPGEAWPDSKMINELAKRVGLREHFFEDWEESLDLFMADSGMTYKEFCQPDRRVIHPTKHYLKDNPGHYFKTPSGKFEFYSQQMDQLGIDPLPTFKEVSTRRFGKEQFERFPLYLPVGKEGVHVSSGSRHIDGMKKHKAEAVCELNPRTAARYGLKEGEMIYIESRKGRIQQRLKISEHVHPNVILATFGWWDTEAANNEYDWRKHNINILSEGDGADRPATGLVQLHGIQVRVYAEEQAWGSPRKAKPVAATMSAEAPKLAEAPAE